jgi:hypothetical protein
MLTVVLQAPAGPDDYYLQAAISQADALLRQQVYGSVAAPQPEPRPPGGQQPLALPQHAASSQQQQPPPLQPPLHEENDWLQRMRQADAALKAAIERSDTAVGQPG